MGAFEQIPLVGPGHELQLTLDGRAVPHLEVVRARAAAPEREPEDVAATADGCPAAEGQITL